MLRVLQSQRGRQHFVKRMTRFFVTTGVESTLLYVGRALDKLSYVWKKTTSGEVRGLVFIAISLIKCCSHGMYCLFESRLVKLIIFVADYHDN